MVNTETPYTISLTYDRAAAAVGCSRRTIERAVDRGELRAAAISPRRRVIAVTELAQWLVERTLNGRPLDEAA